MFAWPDENSLLNNKKTLENRDTPEFTGKIVVGIVKMIQNNRKSSEAHIIFTIIIIPIQKTSFFRMFSSIHNNDKLQSKFCVLII